MRLCLISLDVAPVRSSGLAVYAERLAQRLVAGGHEVTMVAARRPGTLPRTVSDGMVVDRVAIGRSDWIGYGWHAARHVAQQHARQPFDRVHFLDVHFAWAYRGPFVASLLQSFHQRLTADNGQPYASSAANRAFRRVYYTTAMHLLEQPTLHRAQALVSLSEATRQEFVTHYGLSERAIALTPESVDTDYFAPQPAARVEPLRQQLGLQGCRVLLYVGFSNPRKGLEYLVAGLDALPDDVRLIIVGQWDAAYRQKVVEAAGGGWKRVLEVGSVPDAVMPVYYALADLVVLPSLLEGFGLPALEALACGTPLVATRAGSLPEVIGPCGLLVSPRNTPALVEAISSLLADPTRRAALSVAARARARSHFSAERAYESIMNVYNASVR